MKREDWKVYLLRCADGSLYCGIALDVDKRLSEHNDGEGSKYVRSRLPAKLVWSDFAGTRSLASKREYAIKQFSKQEKENLIGAE